MRFCPVHLTAGWVGMAAGGVLTLSAAAQQTIQFTKPVDVDQSGQPNAILPANNNLLSSGTLPAPMPLFGDKTPSANFSALPGSDANAAQGRNSLQDSRNWMFMTPEEILNVPTAKKILGVTDSQADSKLSPEERFLQQLDRQSAKGTTNALRRADSFFFHNDAADNDPFQPVDAGSRFTPPPGGFRTDPSRNLNPYLQNNVNPNTGAGAIQPSDSVWSSSFSRPMPLSKPTPEQLAGMDQFRALLEPSAAGKAPGATAFPNLPAVAPDPNLQSLPAYNPAGRSFSALESDITKPKGLMPLPGVTGPRLQAPKPAALVQPPPWLSDRPQAFTPPQRQF
jgi:hypothetical protein